MPSIIVTVCWLSSVRSNHFVAISNIFLSISMLDCSVWLHIIVITYISIPLFCSASGKHESSSMTCSSNHHEHNKYSKLVNQFIRIYGYERVLEESICLTDGHCIRLSDHVDDNDGFVRVLKTDYFLISAMHLKIPESKLNHDTSKWSVDKSRLVSISYTSSMIEEMFTSGAVQIRKDAESQVLMIGLGAGFIGSYLHHTYPKMQITVAEIDKKMLEIATKWFDLTQDSRHTVTIMDGIDFMKQAFMKGLRYDVILIDACTMKENVATNCPVDVFYEKKNLDILSKLPSSTGVVIINVLNVNGRPYTAAQNVKTAYEKVFKQCTDHISEFSPLNTILTCSHFERPESLLRKYMKFANYTISVN